MNREGAAIRIGASLVDLFLLQLALSPLALLIAKNVLAGLLFGFLIPCTGGHSAVDAEESMAQFRALSGIFCAGVFAYSFSDVWLAGTPGKLLLGLRIRQQDGTPASLRQRATRWAVKYCWLFVYGVVVAMVIAGIDFLHAALATLWVARLAALAVAVGFFRTLRPEKQAFHDSAAATAVFRMPRAAAGV